MIKYTRPERKEVVLPKGWKKAKPQKFSHCFRGENPLTPIVHGYALSNDGKTCVEITEGTELLGGQIFGVTVARERVYRAKTVIERTKEGRAEYSIEAALRFAKTFL